MQVNISFSSFYLPAFIQQIVFVLFDFLTQKYPFREK